MNSSVHAAYANFATDFHEPEETQSYDDAIHCSNSYRWKEAMKEEFDSLMRNQTWTLAELPTGGKAIKNKWVFKIKYEPSGEIQRYKARLIAKGFSQKEGIDFSQFSKHILPLLCTSLFGPSSLSQSKWIST